jgi:hypothetical protein
MTMVKVKKVYLGAEFKKGTKEWHPMQVFVDEVDALKWQSLKPLRKINPIGLVTDEVVQ